MKIRILIVAVGLVAAAAGCAPKDSCGGRTCTAEQRCTPSQFCVTDLVPALTLDEPVEGARIAVPRVMVKGVATDDAAEPRVEVSVNAGPWTRVTLAAAGGFSTEVPLPESDAVATAIDVRAVDSKGREVKVSRAVTVDTVKPSCAVTAPAEGAVITSVGLLPVTLSAADGSLLLANPRVSTDGALTFSAPVGDGGSYTFEWDLASANGVEQQLVFRVDDGASHTCEVTRTVMVDNVKPTVGFASPDAGALLGPAFFAAGGVLSGPASDGTRLLKSVTVSFADAGLRAATVQGGQWTIAISAPAGDDFKPQSATVVATDLADNTASATLAVTVDVVAPVLAITAPAASAKLNAASFAAGDNVALAWTLTDGDSQLSIGVVRPDGGVLSPPVVTTASTDNPKTYQPTLVAADRAGNSSTASVTFSVDRVAPTLTAAVPANNTRMFAGFASAEFSEPMIGDAGMTLVPPATGAWTTTQRWTTSALAKDTVYSASIGAVTDLYGNPVVASSFKFHTDTWRPTPGVALYSGAVGVINEVVADQEGALSLVLTTQPGTQVWIQFDSSTGAPQVLATVPPAQGLWGLTSWRTVGADLSSRRVIGVSSRSQFVPNPRLVAFKLGSAAVQQTAGEAFIPSPAFPAEGVGLGEYGVISGGEYVRSGRPNVTLGFTDVNRIRVNGLRWEIFRDLSAGGAESQTFGCYYFEPPPLPPGQQGSWSCGVTPVAPIAQGGLLSNAISSFCTVNHRQAGSTATVRWQPTCGPFGNTPPCTPDNSISGSGWEVVADLANDGTFYSYVVNGPGAFQILKLVVDSTCGGSWVAFKLPIAVPLIGVGIPRLVVIRGVPGVIYSDNGEVRFIVP